MHYWRMRIEIEFAVLYDFYRMKKIVYFLLFLFPLMSFQGWAQLSVSHREGQAFLQFPWAGGMDACQFAAFDLNMDGIDDLVVFDRRGNRWMFFLNDGLPGQISYTYAPQYAAFFPKAFDWVVFADYNNDGKKDLFTYSPGWAGMRVFRNVGVNQPEFVPEVTPFLTSFQGGGYVNIISTNADQPAIVDIDKDGDLDILTFWVLGGYIELHENKSVQLFGHSDSLKYTKTDFCWGRIAENEENNLVYLDTCLFNRSSIPELGPTRHRGATMLVHDLTGNGLPDLLLGDVDYPGLTLLINGGSLEKAFIVQQDTSFPSNDVPVRLYSMPAAALVDVNNDGLKDLIVSPFDPNPFVTENHNSVWLYLNVGTEQQPIFSLYTKSFLQDQMIDLGSGAYPLLYDISNRGVKDLIVGNFGRYVRSWYIGQTLHSAYVSTLSHYQQYQQDGNTVFKRISDDLAGLSALGLRGLVPALADLNGNGLPDMLVGSENGKLLHLTQSTVGNWQLESEFFQQITVGSWSAPELFDIDEDGVVDLLVGGKNGKIAYYKGFDQGGAISFQKVTDYFGQVNVTDYNLSYDGYSTPRIFYSSENELMLLSGSEQGKVFLFDQISGNLNGTFRERNNWQTLLDTSLTMIDPGMRSAAWLGSIGNGSGLQMLVGNFSGGLELYNASALILPGLKKHTEVGFFMYPNPARDEVHIQLNQVAKENGLFRIIDMKGGIRQEIPMLKGTDKLIININDLQPGLYLLQHIHSGGTTVHKLVIW